MENKTENKRTWHYVQNPKEYGVKCDVCQGINIEWSEFEHKIWCYDCKIDTKGTDGIFNSPIPVKCAEMLGIKFDKFDMINNKVIPFTI